MIAFLLVIFKRYKSKSKISTIPAYISILGLILFFGACAPSKYLKENEFLLKESSFQISGSSDKRTEKQIKKDLRYFIKQTPNRKFLGIKRSYFSLQYRDQEVGGIKNWIKTSIGEPAVFYDPQATLESSRAMEQYLRYKKGYFHAKVDFEPITHGSYQEVNYIVDPGPRYTINSIQYITKDTVLLTKLDSLNISSLLKKGDFIDADIFDQEKNRIAFELQNLGYAEFTAQFIDIKGDSAALKNSIDIFLDILTPSGDSIHRVYRVGELRVFTDYYARQDSSFLLRDTLNDIEFLRESNEFIVKPSVISTAIKLRENALADRNSRARTFKKLSELGAYRFSTIYPRKSMVDSTIIDYDIILTPHNKKWTTDVGSDVFYSTVSQVRRVIGLGFNTLFENRNFLGGSERYTASAETGIEFQINPTLIQTFSLNLQNNLELPLFKDPLKTIRFLRNVGLLTEDQKKQIFEDGTTSIRLGFNYIDVLNFYKINSFFGTYGYKFILSQNSTLTFNQVGLNLNRYQLSNSFIELIDSNQFIINSFKDNLFTGFLFRDVNYIYSGKKSPRGWTFGFIGGLEISGGEVFLANELANLFTGKNESWKLPGSNGNIEIAKYARVDLDFRLNKYLTKGSSLAGRFNIGGIISFADTENTPYIKQFNVGGPNSMRAWDQRALGPGGHVDLGARPAIFFQQGDLRIEANLEYRFDLFWILEGALFVDAGNIWTINDDPSRPQAKFQSDFLKEMAIGMGYGLRWDLNYFNIRFDFGYRVRNPFPQLDTNRYWYTWREIRQQKLGNLQVAVNYPF